MVQLDVTIPINEDIKNKFDSLCYELGVNATSVLGAFIEASVVRRAFPTELEIEPDPFYSQKNIERLNRAIANLEAGGGTYHDIIEVDDAEDMGR
jgi:DNA-damage-inducible protein J